MAGEGTLVVRCEASALVGGGHLLRCATLADELTRRGWNSWILTDTTTSCIASKLVSGRVEIAIVRDDGWSERLPARVDWLVVDHQRLGRSYESRMRERCERVAAIDDAPQRRHDCDLLLDQNLGRRVEDYRGLLPAHCEVLAGPRYALLRPEFACWRRRRRQRGWPYERPPTERLLVSAGLTDPAGLTPMALDAIVVAAPHAQVDVMLGATSQFLSQVRERVAANAHRMTLHVEPREPAALAAACWLAVGAGGSSAWERCCLGLPALVVTVAANQVPGTRALDGAGAVRWLGDVAKVRRQHLIGALRRLLARPKLVARMARRSLSLCDGEGAHRVAAALEARAGA